MGLSSGNAVIHLDVPDEHDAGRVMKTRGEGDQQECYVVWSGPRAQTGWVRCEMLRLATEEEAKRAPSPGGA